MIDRRRALLAVATLPLLWMPQGAFAASRIHALEGTVFVNGRRARSATPVAPGDRIVVSHDGMIDFTIGADAFRLGPRTCLDLDGGADTLRGALRLLTGTVLGVFGPRRERLSLSTAVATIGIRGTGVYLHARPGALYACTCYGNTELGAGETRENISARHHIPRDIVQDANGVPRMSVAPMREHDDDQLRHLEALLGRVPLFDA